MVPSGSGTSERYFLHESAAYPDKRTAGSSTTTSLLPPPGSPHKARSTPCSTPGLEPHGHWILFGVPDPVTRFRLGLVYCPEYFHKNPISRRHRWSLVNRRAKHLLTFYE